MALHDLDPVAERVFGEESRIPFDWLFLPNGITRLGEIPSKLLHVPDQKCRMRLSCRMKVRIDADMQTNAPALEPAAAG